VFIGRVRPDRQFDIVWSSRTAVRPVPFPLSRPRSEWVRLVDDLRRSWGGRWSGAAAGWPAPGEAARP
jgi:urea transport system substrate-binding protein